MLLFIFLENLLGIPTSSGRVALRDLLDQVGEFHPLSELNGDADGRAIRGAIHTLYKYTGVTGITRGLTPHKGPIQVQPLLLSLPQ